MHAFHCLTGARQAAPLLLPLLPAPLLPPPPEPLLLVPPPGVAKVALLAARGALRRSSLSERWGSDRCWCYRGCLGRLQEQLGLNQVGVDFGEKLIQDAVAPPEVAFRAREA
jgi:hypothetical protein